MGYIVYVFVKTHETVTFKIHALKKYTFFIVEATMIEMAISYNL